MVEQLPLPGFQLREDKPLLHLETAMDLLGRTEDDVVRLCESGELSHCWDIASAGATRREIRIWRRSFLAYWHGTRPQYETDDAVVALVIGHGRPAITGPEAQRILSCGQWLVRDLAKSKVLAALNEPTTGPNGALRICANSFRRFLLSRLNRL